MFWNVLKIFIKKKIVSWHCNGLSNEPASSEITSHSTIQYSLDYQQIVNKKDVSSFQRSEILSPYLEHNPFKFEKQILPLYGATTSDYFHLPFYKIKRKL